jgi:hypothetical protein
MIGSIIGPWMRRGGRNALFTQFKAEEKDHLATTLPVTASFSSYSPAHAQERQGLSTAPLLSVGIA